MAKDETKKVTVADVLALAEQVDEASIVAEIDELEAKLTKLHQARKTISLIKHGPKPRKKPEPRKPKEAKVAPVATTTVARPANGQLPATIKDRVIEHLEDNGAMTANDIGVELNLQTSQVYGVLQAPGNKALFKKLGDGRWELT